LDMLIAAAAILIGVVLLTWGADRLVIGAGATARNLGVAPIVIGLVIVGFGTSAPEMLVSAFASARGAPSLAVGNAVGSNTANLGLVLGSALVLRPLTFRSQILRRELPALLVATALAFLLLLDGDLGRADGLLLLLGLLAMISWMLILSFRTSVHDPMRAEYEAEIPSDMSMTMATTWLTLGLAMLLGGAALLVQGAEHVARAMGVSELVIGLTVVAIGTSLPELAFSVAAALQNESDLVLGNVLGSNFFNLLAVIGISGVVRPHRLDGEVLTVHYPVMAALTLAIFILAYSRIHGSQLGRRTGAALLTAFIVYHGSIAWESFGS